jgi:hypothetical protein
MVATETRIEVAAKSRSKGSSRFDKATNLVKVLSSLPVLALFVRLTATITVPAGIRAPWSLVVVQGVAPREDVLTHAAVFSNFGRRGFPNTRSIR